MSFAEEMGHDIPDYGMDEGRGYGGYRSPFVKGFNSGNLLERHAYLEIVFTTDKAWLFQMKHGKIWVPKSVGTLYEKELIVDMPRWFIKTLTYVVEPKTV